MTLTILLAFPRYALTLWGWLLVLACALALTCAYVAASRVSRRLLSAFGVSALLAAILIFPPIYIDCSWWCCDWICWLPI